MQGDIADPSLSTKALYRSRECAPGCGASWGKLDALARRFDRSPPTSSANSSPRQCPKGFRPVDTWRSRGAGNGPPAHQRGHVSGGPAPRHSRPQRVVVRSRAGGSHAPHPL